MILKKTNCKLKDEKSYLKLQKVMATFKCKTNNNSRRCHYINNDSNENRVFECGCTVEWHLDKIKFTDCAAHSDKGVEVRAVDKVTITVV
jgi:hypothetical protein